MTPAADPLVAVVDDEVAPPTIRAIRRGTGHSYEVNGDPVKGVTTLIRGGVPSEALKFWAADEAARFAVEHPGLIEEVGAVRAYEQIRRAPFKRRDELAVNGTKVHRLAEHLARGDEVEVEPEHVGYVDACVAFLDEHEVAVLHSEATVASVTHRYAGTLDLLADTAHGRALIDYKTGSGVYPEAALQLAAYRHAEWLVGDLGDVVPMPAPIDLTAVCHLRADGTYALVPVLTDEAVHRTFLYAAQVAIRMDGARDALIGPPLARAV